MKKFVIALIKATSPRTIVFSKNKGSAVFWKTASFHRLVWVERDPLVNYASKRQTPASAYFFISNCRIKQLRPEYAIGAPWSDAKLREQNINGLRNAVNRALKTEF